MGGHNLAEFVTTQDSGKQASAAVAAGTVGDAVDSAIVTNALIHVRTWL